MTVLVAAVLFGAAEPATSHGQSPQVLFEDGSLDARTKDLLSRYARQVRPWGMIQRAAEAVEAEGARALSPEELAERNRRWAEGRNDELADEILANECSQGLQTLLGANAGYASAYVLEPEGRVVCMSRRPDRYAHGGIPGWQEAVSDGDLWVARAVPTDDGGLDRIRIVVPVLKQGAVVGGMVVEKLVPKL